MTACSEAEGEVGYNEAEVVVLTERFAPSTGEPNTVQFVARGFELDFRSLVYRALSGNDEALIELLEWANSGLDGAASEGYGLLLVSIAEVVGDNRMARVVGTLGREELVAVCRYFHFEFMDGNELLDKGVLLKTFPKLGAYMIRSVPEMATESLGW